MLLCYYLPLPSFLHANGATSAKRGYTLQIPIPGKQQLLKVTMNFAALNQIWNSTNAAIIGVVVIVSGIQNANDYRLRIFIFPHFEHFIAPSTLTKSPNLWEQE